MHDKAGGLVVLLPQLLEAAVGDPLAARSGASASCKLAPIPNMETALPALLAQMIASVASAAKTGPPDNCAKQLAKCAI
eukprot:6622529-Alexandrium_andersonii.AAC.1